MSKPSVSRINIYPMKSFDGCSVNSVRVVARGALEFDRRWIITDAQSDPLNAKRTADIHRLRASYDPTIENVTLSASGHPTTTFPLRSPMTGMIDWLSNYFGFPVMIFGNPDGGFPDDPEASGPTIISTASLEHVAKWFDLPSVEDARARFRANIEIAGVEPFWEDRLCAEQGSIPFRIGDIHFEGRNPCQRCVVPSRSPISGEVISGFAKKFSTRREETLPDWAPRGRFDHFYRLSINTNVDESCVGKSINVGDELVLL